MSFRRLLLNYQQSFKEDLVESSCHCLHSNDLNNAPLCWPFLFLHFNVTSPSLWFFWALGDASGSLLLFLKKSLWELLICFTVFCMAVVVSSLAILSSSRDSLCLSLVLNPSLMSSFCLICALIFMKHILYGFLRKTIWEVKFMRPCTNKNVFIFPLGLINSLFGSRILGWKFLSEFWRHCFCWNFKLFWFLILGIWPALFLWKHIFSLTPKCLKCHNRLFFIHCIILSI